MLSGVQSISERESASIPKYSEYGSKVANKIGEEAQPITGCDEI
ncbi:hypothetical protein DFR72_117159 [Lentzea flaviverrucosa]|uniref:Uncharacterized protein n=1 Tax=Lentzea flaviverrucosa TaxID=200379 RepID=A0A1H9XSD1_9PSEU|nr:hypothetical protein DFR72_117159 [Lentzea flaviverrucosa]SES49062.1 hypothetical protein SAMN05216195_11758 [Lentzea flaviverrucosa]